MNFIITTAGLLVIMWSLVALYTSWVAYQGWSDMEDQAAKKHMGVYTYAFSQMIKSAMEP